MSKILSCLLIFYHKIIQQHVRQKKHYKKVQLTVNFLYFAAKIQDEIVEQVDLLHHAK